MIGHVGVRVSNLSRSIDFYGTVLGFKVVKRVTSQSGVQICFLKDDQSVLELIEVKDFIPAPTDTHVLGVAHFAMDTANAEEAAKKLKAKGIETSPLLTGVTRLFSFKDPDGIRIEVSERLPD